MATTSQIIPGVSPMVYLQSPEESANGIGSDKPSFLPLGRLDRAMAGPRKEKPTLSSGREPVGAAARGKPILDAGQLPSAP